MKRKDSIFSTFFYGSRDKALRPESREIYRRNTKIKMAVSLLLIVGVLMTVLIKGTGFASKHLAWLTLAYVATTAVVELIRGETFYQLRLHDRKVDKTDARKILKSMERVGDGKK